MQNPTPTLLLLAALATPALSASTPPSVLPQDAAILSDLVKRGRALLDEGKPAEAQILFEQADAEAKGELDARQWLLRAWMDQGRINDAFNELDRMRQNGAEGVAVDYVFGMGSYRRALKLLQQGAPNTTGFAFGDAVTNLQAAVNADGDLYYDAWVPLAHAAWYARELDKGRVAADEAVKRFPKDSRAHFVRGQVIFSQYKDERSADPEFPGDPEKAADARASFEAAAKHADTDIANAKQNFEIHNQLGWIGAWTGDRETAAKSFASAIAWDPSSADYSGIWGQVATEESGPQPVVDLFADAHKQFVKRFGKKSQSDATLVWWLGNARMSNEEYEQADKDFQLAVEKWPAYLNSWWYAGLCRYKRKDYLGAGEAWMQYRNADEEGFGQFVASLGEEGIAILRYGAQMIGAEGQPPNNQWLHNVTAAELMHTVTVADPRSDIDFNNLGLFARDGGAFLNSKDKAEDKRKATALFERSWAAYQKAIELDPENPAYLNDGAVLLHYYLERDYEKAQAMYEEAHNKAKVLVEKGEWSTDEEGKPGKGKYDRGITEIALRDSKDNLEKLLRKMKGEPEEGDGR